MQPVPTYHASGSIIFSREHVPMTLERALEAKATHLRNRDYWLSRTDRSPQARQALADCEQRLADEMERAIAAVQQKDAA